ncbi:hypothetical protein NKH18_15575 [Streptomyces sp. M10(2022)]
MRAGPAVQNDRAERPDSAGDGGQDVTAGAAPPTGGQDGSKATRPTLDLSAGLLEYCSKAAAACGLPVDERVARRPASAECRAPESASPRCARGEPSVQVPRRPTRPDTLPIGVS